MKDQTSIHHLGDIALVGELFARDLDTIGRQAALKDNNAWLQYSGFFALTLKDTQHLAGSLASFAAGRMKSSRLRLSRGDPG